MRKLKQIGLAVVLSLTFATSGFAGIIPTVPEPPPAPPSAPESSAMATGIITTPPSAAPTDPVVTFALAILETALSVF